MKYDFITIGGVTEDIVFFTSEGVLIDNKADILKEKLLAFEYGAKINIKEFGHYFGGGASNSAINLSGLSFKVACLSRIGQDERGFRILENLENNKVDHNFIEVDKKSDSGFSFIINNKKDRIIFAYRGANDNFVISKKQEKNIKLAKWVYLTSLPLNCQNSLERIFLNKNNIAWNPGISQLSGGVAPIKRFLENTEIFILNKDEALELIKKTKRFSSLKDNFLADIKNLIKILKDLGPEKIILTDGVKGAYFFDGTNFFHQKIISNQNKIDSTGVGDAFGSTVVGCLIKFDGDYKKSMYLGVKNVSSVVSLAGAQNGLLSYKELIK
ncbi:MAG TPA: PfkB family carbohydrate kinase [bacterium]|nr:PfkB family carbohydrate kinase [bacterium]